MLLYLYIYIYYVSLSLYVQTKWRRTLMKWERRENNNNKSDGEQKKKNKEKKIVGTTESTIDSLKEKKRKKRRYGSYICLFIIPFFFSFSIYEIRLLTLQNSVQDKNQCFIICVWFNRFYDRKEGKVDEHLFNYRASNIQTDGWWEGWWTLCRIPLV